MPTSRSSAAIARSAGRAATQELWAEWDPANYLPELVNEYTSETGIAVTVLATPWGDFQTKGLS